MVNKSQELLDAYQIDLNDLIDDFGEGTISRGETYYFDDKVKSLTTINSADAIAQQVRGSVKGTGNSTYLTTVILTPTSENKRRVSSRCSCPVSYCCKHGVALLLEHIHSLIDSNVIDAKGASKSQQVDHEAELSGWITYLQNSEYDTQTEDRFSQLSKDFEYHLIYLLKLHKPQHDGDFNGLSVRVVKARSLKKGGYGAIYKVSLSDLNSTYHYYTPNYLHTDRDKQIANGLSACQEHGWDLQRCYYLEGEIGLYVLKDILKTERSFWESEKSPALTFSEPRELQLDWVEDDGYYLPSVKSTPPINVLFRMHHMMYVDSTKAQCGVLEHPSISIEQLDHFLSAPPIPTKQAKELSEKIAQGLPEVDFPLPVKLDIQHREICDSDLIVHVKLYSVPHPKLGGEYPINIASIRYEYENFIFQPKNAHQVGKPVSTVYHDNCKIKIHRDSEKEIDAVKQLMQAGLVPVDYIGFAPTDLTSTGKTLGEDAQQWDHLINQILPEFEQAGWVIDTDENFSMSVEIVDDWYAELDQQGGEWFEMSLGFEVNDQSYNLLPMLVDLLAEYPTTEALHESLKSKQYQLLPLDNGQWIKIPTARVLQILDTIIELYDKKSLTDEGKLGFSKHAGLHFNDLLNDSSVRWKGAEELQELNNNLRNFSGIESVQPPDGLNIELRDYQRTGLDWLQFLRSYQFNGILADDMGLGKTVQTLANLLIEKNSGRADLPSLVIAPTSLMSNWRNEANRFTPDLNVMIIQGVDRHQLFSKIAEMDIIITTYPLMLRDNEHYRDQKFHYVVLDEAQAIKNSKAKTTQIIYQIQARHRLCVTGTPMENHLGEIWSMYHFLMPGYLSTHDRFTRLFKTPIEKHSDHARGMSLRKRIDPFLLRRTKELVAKELPEKTQILRTVALTGKQLDLYETVRVAMDKKVRDEINKKGLARSHIMILDALLKLRQVCCHPQLLKLAKAQSVTDSAKLNLLMDMVPEMVEEGRKILIFSQFVSMLNIIETELKSEGISYVKLTGQTQKREEVINKFQEGDAKIFLISLKAGGVGLNLTAADTVIHYDPWWNPAAENQATDRAHRIGQDKPVFVYKLITEGTVEEKILAMQEKKKALADTLYENKKESDAELEQADLLDLLKPLA